MSRCTKLESLIFEGDYSQALFKAGEKLGSQIVKYVQKNLSAAVRIEKTGKLKIHVWLPDEDICSDAILEKDFPLKSEILYEFDEQPDACGIPEGIENQKAMLKELKKMVSYMEKSLANPNHDQ